MSKRKIRTFIARLKKARASVARGNTGCQAAPTKCWACAMRYRSGADADGAAYIEYTGPGSSWSFDRPKNATLKLFDASIAALSATL